jgi:lysophospholipase L1-like esterase
MRTRSAPASDAAPRAAAPWKLLLLAGVSVCVALLGVELALRVFAGQLFGRPDAAGGAIRMVGTRYPGSYDARLGWVPTPGSHPHNVWNTTVTIEPDGRRSNGAPPPPGRPILAVGDSFTFGDEVGDAETWPAQLERELGTPVRNAGVFGYGLDQIALRAEELLAHEPAAALVVSIVPNDVMRCEYAYRYAWKPWFSVRDGALVLEGVPVPEPGRATPAEPAPRRWLRWSFLADLVYRRIDPDDWLLPDSVRMHRHGVEVGALLVERLDALARAHGVPWLLVLNWYPRADLEPARGVVARAHALGAEVVDMRPIVAAELASGRASLADLYSIHAKPGRPLDVGHMTRAGNALVARAIAAHLRERGLLASASPDRR